MNKHMKTFFALPFAGLLLFAGEASALCTYLQDTYSGIVPANSYVVALGPFTITSANGCQSANITTTITALDAGNPPKLFIDRLEGSTWKQVDGGSRSRVTALGPTGTYRVRHVNEYDTARGYSGTTRYGR